MKPAASSDNASGHPLARLLAAAALKGQRRNHPARLGPAYAGREIAKGVISALLKTELLLGGFRGLLGFTNPNQLAESLRKPPHGPIYFRHY
ncbi:MAG: hypothetical protein IPM03_12590 [Sulfuritalea sp.]|nr:hypothetical protein [Sulfuritalea sp.]